MTVTIEPVTSTVTAHVQAWRERIAALPLESIAWTREEHLALDALVREAFSGLRLRVIEGSCRRDDDDLVLFWQAQIARVTRDNPAIVHSGGWQYAEDEPVMRFRWVRKVLGTEVQG